MVHLQNDWLTNFVHYIMTIIYAVNSDPKVEIRSASNAIGVRRNIFRFSDMRLMNNNEEIQSDGEILE